MLARHYAANTKCTAAGSALYLSAHNGALSALETYALLDTNVRNMLAGKMAFGEPASVHAKPYHTTPGRSK